MVLVLIGPFWNGAVSVARDDIFSLHFMYFNFVARTYNCIFSDNIVVHDCSFRIDIGTGKLF